MASDAPPHLDAPQNSDDPAAEPANRARSVSADLEAIFGRAASAEAAAPRASRIRGARRGGGETRRPRLTLAGVGGVAAAALAGIAAGSLVVRPPHAARTAEPPTAAAPALPAIATPPASLPVEMVAPQAAQAEVLPAAAAAPPASVKAAQPTRAHAVRKPKAPRGCCSYVQVQAADRSLRAAYAGAVRAGVSRDEIAAARDRWSATRRRSAHDPIRLVANYRDIADDLNRAAARARVHPARERYARFQPRYAAWWR